MGLKLTTPRVRVAGSTPEPARCPTAVITTLQCSNSERHFSRKNTGFRNTYEDIMYSEKIKIEQICFYFQDFKSLLLETYDIWVMIFRMYY